MQNCFQLSADLLFYHVYVKKILSIPKGRPAYCNKTVFIFSKSQKERDSTAATGLESSEMTAVVSNDTQSWRCRTTLYEQFDDVTNTYEEPDEANMGHKSESSTLQTSQRSWTQDQTQTVQPYQDLDMLEKTVYNIAEQKTVGDKRESVSRQTSQRSWREDHASTDKPNQDLDMVEIPIYHTDGQAEQLEEDHCLYGMAAACKPEITGGPICRYYIDVPHTGSVVSLLPVSRADVTQPQGVKLPGPVYFELRQRVLGKDEISSAGCLNRQQEAPMTESGLGPGSHDQYTSHNLSDILQKLNTIYSKPARRRVGDKRESVSRQTSQRSRRGDPASTDKPNQDLDMVENPLYDMESEAEQQEEDQCLSDMAVAYKPETTGSSVSVRSKGSTSPSSDGSSGSLSGSQPCRYYTDVPLQGRRTGSLVLLLPDSRGDLTQGQGETPTETVYFELKRCCKDS